MVDANRAWHWCHHRRWHLFMPGIIAGKAGPGGILSFIITGFVIMIVAICYEKVFGESAERCLCV
jgi:hypothetical protein